MPFHLWSTDTPEYIEKLLPQFGNEKSYSNKELAEVSSQLGSTGNQRRISHLTQYWYILGLLDREREGNTYIYTVSDFGGKILNLLNFNKSLCFDLLHFALSNAWEIDRNEHWGWSWVYKNTAKLLWETKPSTLDKGKILSQIINMADEKIPEFKAKINPKAISSTIIWLSDLIPPFIVPFSEAKQSDDYSIDKRDNCNPELLLLAICSEYKLRELPFSTPLLIDEEVKTEVSKLCLLKEDQFWPMVDLALITFPSILQKKESLYGSSLILKEKPDFYPPHPRTID